MTAATKPRTRSRWRSRVQASLGRRLALLLAGVGVLSATGFALLLAAILPAADQRALLVTVGGATLLLAIILAGLWHAIARMVLAPLGRLEEHMQQVRASGALAPLAARPRADEIGSLVTSLNAMLRQLKDLREQVEVQSFELGRSDSAIGVMHNVRNALTPVSTILSQGLTQPEPVDRLLLERAAAELARDDVPAARRRKLAAFVAAGVGAAAADRADRRRALEVGREAMRHALEIIGGQQENAHERPALAPCDVTGIIAQNAIIAHYSGERSIAFAFPSHPHWVSANRVLLSQVIGNLFSNAAEAIAAAGCEGGSIGVRVDEQDGRTRVIVTDNGEGFAGDGAARLFQRGFSTRGHKSGGLGLHWCANAMAAMGGTLALESEGAGRGASAILTLESAAAKLAA